MQEIRHNSSLPPVLRRGRQASPALRRAHTRPGTLPVVPHSSSLSISGSFRDDPSLHSPPPRTTLEAELRTKLGYTRGFGTRHPHQLHSSEKPKEKEGPRSLARCNDPLTDEELDVPIHTQLNATYSLNIADESTSGCCQNAFLPSEGTGFMPAKNSLRGWKRCKDGAMERQV